MDHFVKPKDLGSSSDDLDLEAPAAIKYWLALCETFLWTVEADQAAPNPGVDVNNKGLLVNFLSNTVYSYVEDCETYGYALKASK